MRLTAVGSIDVVLSVSEPDFYDRPAALSAASVSEFPTPYLRDRTCKE